VYEMPYFSKKYQRSYIMSKSQGAGWPSKTGGKSGGGRDNNPPKR